MNRFVACLVAFSAIAIVSQVAVSQSTASVNPDDLKHVFVPMPKGRIRAEANNVDKDWTPPVVHLRGNVQVRIYTAADKPRGAIVMRAEEVDINQTTGEISPRGNERMSVEDPK